MKKWIAILTIVCLALSLFAGCKQMDQEESASTDGYVENIEQDVEQDDGPVKIDSDDIDSEDEPEKDDGEEDKDKDKEEKDPTSKPEDDKKTEDTTKPEDDKKPAEKDPAKDEGDQGGDNEEENVVVDYSDYITVCTYNLKSLKMMDQGVYDNLRKIDADIVGLQEVEAYTKNAPGNQVEILAKELGYQYWYFCRCMDFENGGDGCGYGTGFLSRYPVKDVEEHTFVRYVGSETRKFTRAVLDVDGKEVAFYNTHLTTGTWEQTGYQFNEMMGYIYKDKCDYVIMTGDLNLNFVNQKSRVDTKKILPLIGFEEMEVSHPLIGWDAIYITHNMDYYFDEETGTGVKVIDDLESSDHRPMWTYVKLK